MAGQAEQGAGNAGPVAGVGAHHDVLECRHLREEPDVLERAGHPELGDLVRLLAGDRLPGEPHHAFARLVDARDDVERRRLPRPVRTDEPEDLPLADL